MSGSPLISQDEPDERAPAEFGELRIVLVAGALFVAVSAEVSAVAVAGAVAVPVLTVVALGAGIYALWQKRKKKLRGFCSIEAGLKLELENNQLNNITETRAVVSKYQLYNRIIEQSLRKDRRVDFLSNRTALVR
ncbi:hypothetical protein AGOR_G00196820 [Albula goreensis]|uniref:Uncharacterized protein n=1 Tax=Albula goreensis TaxID=1534307 RepID=A0A8T3CRW4_9TELE|nr:hypothetical protein AGOR_G00196820 [Albula goreensis]